MSFVVPSCSECEREGKQPRRFHVVSAWSFGGAAIAARPCRLCSLHCAETAELLCCTPGCPVSAYCFEERALKFGLREGDGGARRECLECRERAQREEAQRQQQRTAALSYDETDYCDVLTRRCWPLVERAFAANRTAQGLFNFTRIAETLFWTVRSLPAYDNVWCIVENGVKMLITRNRNGDKRKRPLPTGRKLSYEPMVRGVMKTIQEWLRRNREKWENVNPYGLNIEEDAERAVLDEDWVSFLLLDLTAGGNAAAKLTNIQNSSKTANENADVLERITSEEANADGKLPAATSPPKKLRKE